MNAFYSKLIIFIGINQLHCQDDDYLSGHNSRKGESFPCMKNNVQCRCEEQVIKKGMNVKCDNIGLTYIPEVINNSQPIRMMDLHNNKITKLTPRMLNGLTNLEKFDLDSNEIAFIEDNTFSNMSELLELYLHNNKITKLTPRMMNGLINVWNFNLSSNEIAFIEDNTFSSMSQLLWLDLHNNKITKLTPRMLNGLINVWKFNLGSNEIAIIEDNTFSSMSQLHRLYLHNNKITKLTPRMLNDLINLKKFHLDSNEIAIIEDNTFSNMWWLQELYLNNNKITKLTPRMLNGLIHLWIFDLGSNEIAIIEDDTFSGLLDLPGLYLNNNKITKLTPRMLNGLINLWAIDLGSNEIAIIEDNTFSNIRWLQELNLSSNEISELPIGIFHGLRKLEILILEDNAIRKIENEMFKDLENLKELNLSSNKISELPIGIFHSLKKLEILILENNAIRKIENDMFKDLENLKELNLARNSIIWTSGEMFNNTSTLTSLTTDEYRLCCLMMKRNLTKCIPKVDENHCNELLKETVLRICVRIVGVVAIFANLFVIVFRTKYNKFYTNKINSLLIRNLAISDLFMGFYLLIIVMADIVFANHFNEKDFKWRCSTWCHLAGILSTFSSSLTAFTLMIITIERVLATISPFRTKLQEMYQVKISLAIAWIVAVIIAIIPLPFFQIKYFDQFYSRSGTCLPLHMSSNKPHAWHYSVFIFLVLYSIAFTIMLLSYAVIYQSTKKTRQAVNVSNEKSLQHMVMIFRMTLFVLADATCKIPVIILGVQSLSEDRIKPMVYQWMAIFVTPLNAALNPILYTLSSLPSAFRFMEYLQSLRFRSPIIIQSPVYRKSRNQTAEIENRSSNKTTHNKRRKKESS